MNLIPRPAVLGVLFCLFSLADPRPMFAQDAGSAQTAAGVVAQPLDLEEESEAEEAAESLRTETSTNENPDAVRRAERQVESDVVPGVEKERWQLETYGSVRLHAINAYDLEKDSNSSKLGDGESRVGLTGEWNMRDDWYLFGRLEAGFDVLDGFTAGTVEEEDGLLRARLHKIGVESDHFYLTYGKSWSVYYTVAGAADRFSIFGGEAVGIYNAGTDGGATGTGRADSAFQTEFYIDFSNWLPLKPFNLNLQHQNDEPIPEVHGQHYGVTWSASAWLEWANDFGVGIAHHNAAVDLDSSDAIREAGIDGDAVSTAVAIKTYGDRWLVSLVVNKMDNIETTNLRKYINGNGAELFGQWQFRENWWLVGGGNWLKPDEDDPNAGRYEVKYGVLGMRYTFDAFNRMVYAEWKDDHGTLFSGRKRKNEITVGVRWDFGY